jgi:hypothetical protein
MRVVFCLFTLLCGLSAHALAGMPGIGGEWHFYGNQDATVFIDEASGILEDRTRGASYVLGEEQKTGRRKVAGKGGSHPGDGRAIIHAHKDVLLFLGVKNPILLRKGAHFKTPREKIRGRWHYAVQTNEAFYYDAEFDLDAGKMVEISRPESGGHTRSADRPLEMLLDAQAELAVQSDGAIYHFARLGADFLVLEPSYATSSRDGYKILMARTQAPKTMPGANTNKPEQADKNSGTAKAAKASKSVKSSKTSKTAKASKSVKPSKSAKTSGDKAR